MDYRTKRFGALLLYVSEFAVFGVICYYIYKMFEDNLSSIVVSIMFYMGEWFDLICDLLFFFESLLVFLLIYIIYLLCHVIFLLEKKN